MIDLVFANKGTGKSTYLTMRARKALKSKKYWRVYSTEPTAGCYDFDVKRDFGIKDISYCHEEEKRKPVLLLVGEGAIDFPNTKTLPEHQKKYARLSRHYFVDIVIASQSYEDVNIVIRRLYDRMYLMSRSPIFMHMSFLNRIKKNIGIDETTHQIIEEYYFVPWFLGGLKPFYRRPWYKYFDSYDAPDLEFADNELLPDLDHTNDLIGNMNKWIKRGIKVYRRAVNRVAKIKVFNRDSSSSS